MTNSLEHKEQFHAAGRMWVPWWENTEVSVVPQALRNHAEHNAFISRYCGGVESILGVNLQDNVKRSTHSLKALVAVISFSETYE